MKTSIPKFGAMLLASSIIILAGTLPAADDAAHQALINPDFSQPLIGEDPPGWFRAMIPGMTESLEAGRGEEGGEYYLYMTQKGSQPNLFNNWAQRLDNPPIGATLTLSAELATSGVTGPGAAALVMLFDANGNDCGSVSSEGQVIITGDVPFTPITLQSAVPPAAQTAIVRFGLLPGSEGTLKVRRTSLMVKNGASVVDSVSSPRAASWEAGLELLINGDFEAPVVVGHPPGWFRAMIPNQTDGLSAGVSAAGDRGQVAYIYQNGLKARVINNWAQRLDIVPIGATLRLQADVKTHDLPENTGFIMVQCWGDGERLLAAATTQTSQPLGGSADWKTVGCEVTVPVGTQTIIVRCGLSNAGNIWFDNVSLTIVKAPVQDAVAATGVAAPLGATDAVRGVRVDEAYLKQLEQVNGISRQVEAAVREAMPQGGDQRTEIFALGGGKFDIVVHLDLTAGDAVAPNPDSADVK